LSSYHSTLKSLVTESFVKLYVTIITYFLPKIIKQISKEKDGMDGGYYIHRETRNAYRKFCPLAYNAMQFVESQPTFRRNMSPPSSGSKNNPSKTQRESRWQGRIYL
jgi:hypothetical protein